MLYSDSEINNNKYTPILLGCETEESDSLTDLDYT